MRTRPVQLLAAALAVSVAPLAASTFVAMSFTELVEQADAVVEGEVVELASAWSESGRIIQTDALVRVADVLAGAAASAVTVRTPGGQVGDFIVEAHGFPRLERGERVILFLVRDPAGETWRILGYQQGHFRLVTRLDGVTVAVPMVDDDVLLLDRAGRPVERIGSQEVREFRRGVGKVRRRRPR